MTCPHYAYFAFNFCRHFDGCRSSSSSNFFFLSGGFDVGGVLMEGRSRGTNALSRESAPSPELSVTPASTRLGANVDLGECGVCIEAAGSTMLIAERVRGAGMVD